MPRKRRPPRPGALADLSPMRILSQIALLQLAYYASAAVLLLFSALVAGHPIRVALLLGWGTVRADTTIGWMLALVWMLNALIMVIFILLIVGRSKLVLDFACTIHFLHLIAVSLFSRRLPPLGLWWALQAASAALMTVLGVWACQRRELIPISFGGNKATNEEGNIAGGQGGPAGEDEELGFSRGRGRGRGRDGAGQYEMVGIGQQEG